MATSVLAGALGLLGKKPTVPEAPNVNAQNAQRTAISGNLQSLPDLENLTKQINSFSIDELMKNLEKALPGYGKLLSQGTAQIDSFLKGEIPQDVKDQVLRFDAEKAAGGGYSGSPVQSNLSARDLGLTSLDLVQKGLSSAERWMQQAAARTPQFDFTRMFVTPGQQIAADQWNEEQRFSQQWMRNKIKAMPSPTEAAAAGFFNSFATLGENYISAGGGYAPGGGGGKSTDKGPDYGNEAGGNGSYDISPIGYSGGNSGE